MPSTFAIISPENPDAQDLWSGKNLPKDRDRMDAPGCSSIFAEACDATNLLLGPAFSYIGSSALVLGKF